MFNFNVPSRKKNNKKTLDAIRKAAKKKKASKDKMRAASLIQAAFKGFLYRKKWVDTIYARLSKRFNDLEKVVKIKAARNQKFILPLQIVSKLIFDIHILIKYEKILAKTRQNYSIVNFCRMLGNLLGEHFYKSAQNLALSSLLPSETYLQAKILNKKQSISS